MKGREEAELARYRRMFEEAPRDKPNGNGEAAVGTLWKNLCQKSLTSGAPICNLFNAVLALRHDPQWIGRWRFNEMLRQVVAPADPLTKLDAELTHLWMQSNGLTRMGRDTVDEAIDIVAHDHAFHPLRDWLQSLKWDGDDRLAFWLHHCVRCPDDEYHRSVSANFLKAMVARIFEPGCQADYMLVLEGEQGQQKSKLCRTLAGQYFSAHLPKLDDDNVRLSMHLKGKWLIEIADLSAIRKTSDETLKAFITRPIEQYTPKFSPYEVFEPRQCLFVGTTNKYNWMHDESGGRRFWPVRCAEIDIRWLIRNREQLFAEAVYRYREGETWFPDPAFEAQYFKPEQRQRFQDDAWQTVIADWDFSDAQRDANGKPLYDPPVWPDNGLGTPLRRQLEAPYHLIQIAQGALHFDAQKLSRAETLRLVAVLESLDWVRAKHTQRGTPWNPPATDGHD